jgi:predicted NACHT family NTPase
VIDWNPYLKSICQKYDRWWDSYTLTDVVSKNRDKQVVKSFLFDLQALIVKPEVTKPERELLAEAREDREVLNVLEGLRKYAAEHVLLIGRPGSGKSTALVRSLLELAEGFGNTGDKEDKSVIASAAKRKEAISPTAGKTRIPVLVELRYYETSILDLITAFLHRHDPSLPIDNETVKELLRQGNCFLLIDGVNELPSPEARSHLQKFRQDYQQTTPMIFTTRDLGVGGDLGIDKKLEMQPLTETQMGEFVRGYLGETGEQMLQQLGGRLREFGETPLLLMMLCSVFASNGNQIPTNLGSVFQRFTEIYDRQIKQDIPVTDESRRWWKRLLQHLAWAMMHGNTKNPQCRDAIHRVSLSVEPTEFLIAIPRHQAEEIFTAYLEGKVNCAADCAIKWLDDLLKHHLIQIGAGDKIEFRHQLIQEYYAAERFLQEVGKLSDDELQWDYLNYLKWTEPTALMLGLVDDEVLALRVVRLALQVDWQLGARLAGEVRVEWQEKTVGLVEGLDLPVLLIISLLGNTKSNSSIPRLIKFLEYESSYIVRYSVACSLGKIKSEAAIPGLIQLLEDDDFDICQTILHDLGKIKSEAAIPGLSQLLKYKYSDVRNEIAKTLGKIKSEAAISDLIQLLKDGDSDVRYSAADALGKIKSEAAISDLIQLLKDGDSDVRYSAADALGKIKSEAAIPDLIQFLKDEDSEVRWIAASILRDIKSEEENSSLHSSTAYALKRTKSDVAILRLIQNLDYENLDIHLNAIEDEGKLKFKAAMIGLVKVLKNQNFIQKNNGENTLDVLDLLKLIQQHLKYYKPQPDRTMSNILSHNYALLIGVGECKEEPKLSLPTTVKDIQAVKTLLTNEKLCGYIDSDQHLRLLSNAIATSANILEGLNWLKQQAENDPEATIFIYYSGHGCLDASGDYYLIPHETDRTDIADTALPATTFNAALQQIPAKQLLVIIDSCHAQGMASSKDNGIGANNVSRANNRSPLPKGFTQTALPQNIIDALTKDINKQGTGKVVFTSSTGNQPSWIRPDGKMSVFTYHLLEALQGAANQPGDKVVRVSHLMNYLSKTVPETARELCKAEQTPFFDFATEDFPVALLCGGKGLATAGYDKQQAEETIRGISNQVNNGVGIVGDRNIGINIGTAGDITFGDLSSGS